MKAFKLIGADDLDAIAAAMDTNAPGTGTRLRRRARWLLLDNPWRGDRPLGVQFVEDGRVAGYVFGVPQPLWVDGRQRPGWFGMGLHLDAAHRGTLVGTSLYQAFFRLGGDAVSATTTGNATSNEVWRRLGARALPGGDDSHVLPLQPWRLVPAWVERRAGVEVARERAESGWRPRRVRPRRVGRHRTSLAADLGELADLWRRVRGGFGLATDRTESWLRWRFGLGAPPSRVVAVRQGGEIRAFYAFRLARRGGRVGVWTSLLLDLVAAPDDTSAVRAAARDFVVRSAFQGAHLVEVRGLHPRLRAAVGGPWFRRRALPSNGYLARDPAVDLPDPATWHLVPADGDAGFW